MRRLILAAAAVLSAGPALAQDAAAHSFSGPDGITVEVQTLAGRAGPFPHMLQFGEETPSVLTFTAEIAMDDSVFLGNPRASIVPGAKQPVAVFQVSPYRGFDYSATMTTLCGGDRGIPFIGIESAAGSIRKKGFAGGAAARLYVYEETFELGRVVLRLCKALDLSAD